jgi:hypothetical protein
MIDDFYLPPPPPRVVEGMEMNKSRQAAWSFTGVKLKCLTKDTIHGRPQDKNERPALTEHAWRRLEEGCLHGRKEGRNEVYKH